MNDIIDIVKSLKGCEFKVLYRALDMVGIDFGEEKAFTDIGRIVAVHSIHIQCPFRILADDKIMTGYNDVFTPKKHISGDDFDIGQLDVSLFDDQTKKINEDFAIKERVKDISINEKGDAVITLDKLIIEIFVANSDEEEAWRYLNRETDVHVVFYGNTIEILPPLG